ncbi:MAG TPA: glycosyltransferase family 4 protein [bacterium]|jgi:glycosyltransferase involved in cell wall biosynthesis
MKILWVNSGLGRTLSNTRLFGMPPALWKLGDESIVLIGGRAKSPLPDYFCSLPVPFSRLKIYRLTVALLLPYLCIRHKPDILLTDWMSAELTKLAVLFRRLGLLKCKFVHDVRTVPVKEDAGKSWRIYAGSLEYAKANFDGITTITVPLRDEITSKFGIPAQAMAVWTSGVDIEHFRPMDASEPKRKLGLEGKFVAFYHGNVQQNRGVAELVEAMDLLRDLPEVFLLIVGGGHEWATLERIKQEKRLERVILQPGVPYADIPKWIAMADLCIVPLPDHPWWRVSSPLKLMEYLAMGKPVLLTEMQAHRAVMPSDDDAFYVSRCGPQEFANGIRHAINERHRFAKLGQKGRRKAIEELTWEGQAAILKRYLENVLTGEIQLKGERD